MVRFLRMNSLMSGFNVSIELNDNANRYCGDICGDNRFEIIEQSLDTIKSLIKNQNDILLMMAKELIKVNSNLIKISDDYRFKNFR